MFTCWFTVTSLLAVTAYQEKAAQRSLTVAPTVEVKGQNGDTLMLPCGDGTNTGVGGVTRWHTPFGDLWTPGFCGDLDPVYLPPDGSLVLRDTGGLHVGVYLCLRQRPQGSTMFLYRVQVDPGPQNPDPPGPERSSRSKLRQELRSEEQDGISDGQFAGSVAAAVILTFVVGFSSGAASRTHLLRCLVAVTKRFQSPRQQRCQSDQPDCDSVTVTTLPPMCDSQSFEMGPVWDEDGVRTSPSLAPAKPQRSFRKKHEDERTSHLEGCVTSGEEDRMTEVEDKGCGGGGDMGGDKRRTDEGEREGEEEEVEAGGQEELMEKDDDGSDTDSSTETEDEEEKETNEDKKKQTEDEEMGCEHQDTLTPAASEEGEEPPCPSPSHQRRRVIRLYQYDEDGCRYSHLPCPSAEDPGPAPRLKQRSTSLIRLNAIMAAAAAPLDMQRRETGSEESDKRALFDMDI